jgi:hypothetical protein
MEGGRPSPWIVLEFAQVPSYLSLKDLTAVRNRLLKKWHPDKSNGCSMEVKQYYHEHTIRIVHAFEYLQARINNPNDPLKAKPESPSGPAAPQQEGGQLGRPVGAPRGQFRIRTSRFLGTISGLREKELSMLAIQDQCDAVVGAMQRAGKPMCILQFGVGSELHTYPANPGYAHHFHFLLHASAQLDCSSDLFDLKGSCGQTLRTHIKVIESDLHWDHSVLYLMKQGCALLRLNGPPPRAGATAKAGIGAEYRENWGDALMAAIDEAMEEKGCPETAVEALAKTFPKEYILHYDKMLACAVCMCYMHGLNMPV